MELPMFLVPEDVATEIQGDRPIRPVVEDLRRVARRNAGPAETFRLPVLVELDMDLSGRRPDRENVSHVVTEDLVVRIRTAAVHVLEMVRAIVEGGAVIPQIDPVHLNEGRYDLPLGVHDRARRRERPF